MTLLAIISIASAILLAILLIRASKSNTAISSELADAKAQLAEKSIELAKADSSLASAKELASRLESQVEDEKRINETLKAEKEEFKINCGILEERLKNAENRIKESTADRETQLKQFKELAQEVLAEKSHDFRKSNEERLAEILTPFRENIEQFKKTINENYITEAKERHSLQDHIKELMELNRSIGNEAKELTRALRGNTKMQGDWGEEILDNILQKSGLVEGVEYEKQVTRDEYDNVLRNEAGNMLRPDVIVNLPDKNKMIIDSKVSLSAYTLMVNATDPEEQKKAAQDHVQSIRNHINELKSKAYQDYVQHAADFVMMFVPNEGAYLAAMNTDATLWQYAYDNRVVIISPTHLISALKLVNQLWRHDKQTKNAIKIADEGSKLYNKFVGFVEDLEQIEKYLNNTRTSYDNAMNKLRDGRGNLINQVDKLRLLGVKTKKTLPTNDDDENMTAIPESEE